MRQSIPTLGRLYIASSVVLSLLVFAASVDPYTLTFTFKQTVFELALWRPFTALLYLGRIGLLLPLHLIFAALAFSQTRKLCDGTQATLAWLFLLSAIALSLFSTFSPLYFFGSSFVMILLVVWAVQHPTDQLHLFNIGVPSIYLPLVYAATMVLLGSTFRNYMAGLLLGLLIGFLKHPKFVEKHGDPLPTPAFIDNYFRADVYQPQLNFERNPPLNLSNGSQRRDLHFSGTGQRIG